MLFLLSKKRAQNKSTFLSKEEDARATLTVVTLLCALSFKNSLSWWCQNVDFGLSSSLLFVLVTMIWGRDVVVMKTVSDRLKWRICTQVRLVLCLFCNPSAVSLLFFQTLKWYGSSRHTLFLKTGTRHKKKDAADTKKTADEESHINLFNKRSRDEYYPSK